MKISVNEQTQTFYMAMKKEWLPVVTHGIKVGAYDFFAVPDGGKIIVSEAASGTRIASFPLFEADHLLTTSKEGTLYYLSEVGKELRKIIEKYDDFKERTVQAEQRSVEKLGERPPIKDYDSDWIFADYDQEH